MSLLEIRNLTVSFDTASGPFKAVDGIDIQVDKGEVLAIVGESGSGKSVGMLATMGLLPKTATVTADRMLFDGRDMRAISGRERRQLIGRDISMIFQEPMALTACMTGSDRPSCANCSGAWESWDMGNSKGTAICMAVR